MQLNTVQEQQSMLSAVRKVNIEQNNDNLKSRFGRPKTYAMMENASAINLQKELNKE